LDVVTADILGDNEQRIITTSAFALYVDHTGALFVKLRVTKGSGGKE
jgi:hypothetical protein